MSSNEVQELLSVFKTEGILMTNKDGTERFRSLEEMPASVEEAGRAFEAAMRELERKEKDHGCEYFIWLTAEQIMFNKQRHIHTLDVIAHSHHETNCQCMSFATPIDNNRLRFFMLRSISVSDESRRKLEKLLSDQVKTLSQLRSRLEEKTEATAKEAEEARRARRR